MKNHPYMPLQWANFSWDIIRYEPDFQLITDFKENTVKVKILFVKITLKMDMGSILPVVDHGQNLRSQ